MLYLVRENNQGDPVGVHNEAGQQAYRHDAGFFKTQSAVAIQDKHPGQSWEDFAEAKATSANPISNWHTQELPEGNINNVLSQVIQSSQSADQ